VISLTNPATGHEVKTDDASADFWKAAGYRAPEQDKPKAAPRKRAAKKSDN
jgi:hypothetical protein